MYRLTLYLAFILFSIQLSGQSVEGKVVDSEGKGLAFAQILDLEKNLSVFTNDLGDFSIENAEIGKTYNIVHLGYEEIEFIIEKEKDYYLIALTDKEFSLEEVIIRPGIDALNLITDIDINLNPVSSSQEVLQRVPGLFIGQHAGGGKAEQIFLRGFDIDHGTDINITVDGLPVNMVSHAHGQGYADLHFVIPETIENIDFGKGPYYADQGNFNTAGYVAFKTKETLDENTIKAEAGQFNTYRLYTGLKLLSQEKHNIFLASEYQLSDGPFESPQDFHRFNALLRYSGQVSDKDKISFSVSHFDSEWSASGQIPQRAVDSGLITRFGAIDDTEGGITSRTNIQFEHKSFLNTNTSLRNRAYYSRYGFELYSNFTFFLEDPINGDQIKQIEDRDIFGLSSDLSHNFMLGDIDIDLNAGLSLRHDESRDNELSQTLNKTQTLNTIQRGDISETNIGAFLGTDINVGKFVFNPALRFDHFNFEYTDQLNQGLLGSESKGIISPKFNILYNSSSKLQLYLKTGQGFHSNDTRVILAQTGEEILPAARGFDLGFIWKPTPRIFINTAYWYLNLEQEFVYVGDAGIVEPSGRSKRYGFDVSTRIQLLDWMFINIDGNYTHARSIADNDFEEFIPLAPDFTLLTGLNFNHKSGINGSLNVRHMNNRPANEDNSIVAKGYTITDLNLAYQFKAHRFGIIIQNLFDLEWNETQFATESRLFDELEPVEEIHFTPGTPFNLRFSFSTQF